MLAIELARRGVEVRVLDKQAWRPQETRAIGIHARTLEVFRQLGVAEEFVELGHRVDSVTVHSRARRPTQVRFDALDSPYPFLLTLSQDQTQRILDERLESLGIQIERDVPCSTSSRLGTPPCCGYSFAANGTSAPSPSAGWSAATAPTASSAARWASRSPATTTPRTGNYRSGPLAPRNAGRGLAPGDRLPVVCRLLRDAQPCSTLDLLASPLHTLLVLAGDPPDTTSARAAIARLNRWDHIVHTIRIDDRGGVGYPGSRAHQRYHALAGRLLLVRPDGYIAATAPLSRPEDLENYLWRVSVQGPRAITFAARPAHGQPAAFTRPGGLDPLTLRRPRLALAHRSP
jgi:hypothetical protein